MKAIPADSELGLLRNSVALRSTIPGFVLDGSRLVLRAENDFDSDGPLCR